MTWQPIDTAPKDGTIVLVYGLWAGEIGGKDKTPGRYIANWVPSSDYQGYHWLVDGTDAYAAWVKATHWMPLPEPPQ